MSTESVLIFTPPFTPIYRPKSASYYTKKQKVSNFRHLSASFVSFGWKMGLATPLAYARFA